MPRIDLYRNRRFFGSEDIFKIAAALRVKVAELLSGTPEDDITPEQVEVRVFDVHPLDQNTCDMAIDIMARASDGRNSRHDEIVFELAKLMRSHLPQVVPTDPPRTIDTWIELDLSNRRGRKIWGGKDLAAR